MTHESILRQLLTGHTLSGVQYCGECHARLRDGARVVALARRPHGVPSWSVFSLYCPDHPPQPLPMMDDGESALVSVSLGSLVNTARQSHTSALVDVVVEDCALDGREAPA